MPSGNLRVGVVGVGLMGADHAERLAGRIAHATLVAVSDPDRHRAGELADRLGVRVVDDPLDLIADDEVDAVLLASPGFVHEPQLLACIEHGKPVLCEKPMSMDAESSIRVLEAERAGGRPLIQVGFMRRFDPEYVQLKEIIDSGRLGRLLLVHNVHRNKAVPDTFLSEMIVRDSLVHEVDVARFLFGDEIAEITVLSPTATSVAPEGTIDPQIAIFRMASGALVTTEVFVRNQIGYEVRCEITLERGTAVAGRPSGQIYTTSVGDAGAGGGGGHWGGVIPEDFRDRFSRAYDLEVQAWVDASLRGEVVGPTSWDGYAATAVCTAGMESLASGRPVQVELVPREH
jgi:myo-inositol 2-dehydrogenase / D-chiro-inositol 1-dehydrogenase